MVKFNAWLAKRLSDLAPLVDQQNAAGALGSMLGLDEVSYEGEDGDAAMDTGADQPQDETFGALAAAADAEDEAEGDDGPEGEEEEDAPMV